MQTTFLILCIKNKDLFGILNDYDMRKTVNINKMIDYKMYAFKETDTL